MKVAVFGASGFAGTALIERLRRRADIEIAAYIHHIGNAWRLSRACVPTQVVDIRSRAAVEDALRGITHVVNCTRGDSDVMDGGLKNLLAASKAQKVQRFVHLSSMSIYANQRLSETVGENLAVSPPPGSYPWAKLNQDDLVAAATTAGLDCVVLCPPNMSGIYSTFVRNILADIRNGNFALVDGGARPNNVIDVDNLAHAIVLALDVRRGDGQRIFVSDGANVTWKDLSDALLPLAEPTSSIPNVSADALDLKESSGPSSGPSLWQSVKHLVSSDVREAVRRDPRWAKVDTRLRRLASVGGPGMEDRLRHAIEGPQIVSRVSDPNPYSSRYTVMQLRGVWHRLDRARDTIGYEPVFDFASSMRRYRDWYATMYGFGQAYWPLVRALETFSLS